MTNTETKHCVFNIIILDESGSMSSVYEAALSGTNEVLNGIGQSVTKHPGLEQLVQLVTFDSAGLKQRISLQVYTQGMQLGKDDYAPGAMTPLYDAIGATLTPLEAPLAGDSNISVVVNIITDGYENASTEYNLAAVAALIKRLREKGWQIIFMGANVDVEEVAMSMNIRHTMKFSSTHGSTSRAFGQMYMAKMEMDDMFDSNDYKIMLDEEKEGRFKTIDKDLREEEEKLRDKNPRKK